MSRRKHYQGASFPKDQNDRTVPKGPEEHSPVLLTERSAEGSRGEQDIRENPSGQPERFYHRNKSGRPVVRPESPSRTDSARRHLRKQGRGRKAVPAPVSGVKPYSRHSGPLSSEAQAALTPEGRELTARMEAAAHRSGSRLSIHTTDTVTIEDKSAVFLIQVFTGKEDIYRRHIRKLKGPEPDFHLIIPKRKLTIRRRGRSIPTVKPIFPGYVFLVSSGLHPDTRLFLRRIPHFIRFMKSSEGILTPLSPTDRQLLLNLIATGETTRRSVVTFDKDNRVVPITGPLKDCEGTIIKVDRRKRRARVKFPLNGKTFVIDFEYEELRKPIEGKQQ